MATMTFDELPEDEQSAFLAICSDAELDPAGFNVSFTEEMPGDATVLTGSRSVVVQRGATTRAYENNEQDAWTGAFEEEVKAGVFD